MHHLIVLLPDSKFAVTSHPSQEGRDAAAQSQTLPYFKVDQEPDLEAISNVHLFDLYNYLAVKPLPTMKDKAFYTSRLWQLLEHKAAPGEAYVKPTDEDQPAGADAAPAAEEGQMAKTKKAKTAKPKAEKKAAKAVAAKTNGTKSPRADSKTEAIAALLKRKEGCTSEDVLKLTGWPAVSMPAMAKACGLKLTKEKVKGERTRYFGV